jgi:HemY protein
MGAVIGFLILAAVLVAIAFGLGALPGEIGATFGTWTVQAPLPLVLVAGVVLFIIIYILLRLFALLVSTPGRFGRRRTAGQIRKGDRAVVRAFAALAAADPRAAQREAQRAKRLLPNAPMALLVSAEAARLAGNTDESEGNYRALAEQPDAAFLGLRGLMRQALDAGDWTLAADLARRAELAHPGAAWLRTERARLALRTGSWAEALALSGPEAPRAVMATAAAEAATDPIQALRLAKDAFAADPKLAPAALAYASRLRAGREARKAENVIQKAWAASPHPDLATFYLEPVTDPLERVREAERLAGFNKASAESYFLLAQVNLAAMLTGEARRHAQAALAAGLDQRRLWVLKADIEDADAAHGGGEAAAFAAHEALRRSQSARPDPRWRCTTCGAEPGSWHAACPSCGTVGRMQWTDKTVPASGVNGPLVTLLPGAAAT